MRPKRIALSDFSTEVKPQHINCLSPLQAQRAVEFVDFADADLLIYSDFGERHWGSMG